MQNGHLQGIRKLRGLFLGNEMRIRVPPYPN